MVDVVTSEKLGVLLINNGYVTSENVAHALECKDSSGKMIGRILIDLDLLKQSQLDETLAQQVGIETVDIAYIDIEGDVIDRVSAELVSKYNIVPFALVGNEISLAMVNPFNTDVINHLRLLYNLRVKRYFAKPEDIEAAVLRHYGSNIARMLSDLVEDDASDVNDSSDITADKLQELAREPSLVNLVNLILIEAIEQRASDVHIEPFETQVKIKYRIDGMLIEKSPAPKKLQAAIISRIKIMAAMDISERFIPQDGHIEFSYANSKVDIRVSTVPSIYGEAITMRILDRNAALIGLGDLGMSPYVLRGFESALKKPHGIILVTGPTGSGKTTSLYAALNSIYKSELKIITIEDPVEYQLEGIVQMPVNPRRGLTFARGLRHILRQDPDIVMVGEIRDKETAEIAIRAALTGHLVLSTLHTNDAAGAITRLIDMGVEPFLLASSLEAVFAQRLVRKICPYCKHAYEPDSTIDALLKDYAISDVKILYKGAGCSECSESGSRGRIGIFEMLRITDPLRKLIAQRPTSEQIESLAPKDHEFMRHDGLQKVVDGITTPQEVLRVTSESGTN